jgi:hypothetical protein
MNTCKLLKTKNKKLEEGMQVTCHTLPLVIIWNETTNTNKNLKGAQFVHCPPHVIIYNETKKLEEGAHATCHAPPTFIIICNEAMNKKKPRWDASCTSSSSCHHC